MLILDFEVITLISFVSSNSFSLLRLQWLYSLPLTHIFVFCAQGPKANCEMKSVTATELLKQYKQETKALMDRRKKPDSTDSALSSEPDMGRRQRGSGGACPQLGRGLKEGDNVFLDELPTKQKNSDVQAQKNLVWSDNCNDLVIDTAAN